MTGRRRRTLGLGAALAAMLMIHGSARAAQKASFRTLEGEVVAIMDHKGEGGLQLLSLNLLPDRPPREKLTVLLGPGEVCHEIGFEVEEGDRVRVRVLLADDGEPVKAQKILNLSRGVMVRLRTMRGIPLWDSLGAWHGGSSRSYHGGHHQPGRSGGGKSRHGSGGF